LRWHAYHAGQPLTIWADGICINQADGKEKNLQVQLMRKVYSKSQHVLVWLGEVPDTIPEDFIKPPVSSAGNQYLGINFLFPLSAV
jgi:hypothetical protein